MRITFLAILGCWLTMAGGANAQDSHMARVASIKQSFIDRARDVLNSADNIDAGFSQYKGRYEAAKQEGAIIINMLFKPRDAGISATTKARVIITNMLIDKAWRDLPSRDTQRHRAAVAQLQSYIDNANHELSFLSQELVSFKKREHDVWALQHPEEAKRLEAEEEDEDDDEQQQIEEQNRQDRKVAKEEQDRKVANEQLQQDMEMEMANKKRRIEIRAYQLESDIRAAKSSISPNYNGLASEASSLSQESRKVGNSRAAFNFSNAESTLKQMSTKSTYGTQDIDRNSRDAENNVKDGGYCIKH